MTASAGGTVRVLEEAFAGAVGAAHAGPAGTTHVVAVASGAGALAVGLALMGVVRASKVAVSALAGQPVIDALALLGAEPRFGDVDPHTFGLSPARGALPSGAALRAILAEHVAGVPCDLEALAAAAPDGELAILQDASEALTALIRGCSIGAHLRPAVFTLAGVGLLVLHDESSARLGHTLREQLGGAPRQEATRAALAALLRVEADAAALAALALRLRGTLSDLPGIRPPVLDAGIPGCRAWSRFILRVAERRDAVRAALQAAGIDARPPFRLRAALPEAARAAAETLEVPLAPALDPTFDAAAAEAFVERVRAACGSRP